MPESINLSVNCVSNRWWHNLSAVPCVRIRDAVCSTSSLLYQVSGGVVGSEYVASYYLFEFELCLSWKVWI